MVPFDKALSDLGIAGEVVICPVPSGYPSPKLVNLVLRKRRNEAFLFEASASRKDVIDETLAHLSTQGVGRLDGVLVTHCHGDHAGSADVLAGLGRPNGERAPIYVHSASYRFLTHPEASLLSAPYGLLLTRAHWRLFEFNTLSNDKMFAQELRRQFAGYFSRTPKSA